MKRGKGLQQVQRSANPLKYCRIHICIQYPLPVEECEANRKRPAYVRNVSHARTPNQDMRVNEEVELVLGGKRLVSIEKTYQMRTRSRTDRREGGEAKATLWADEDSEGKTIGRQ